MRIAAGSKQHRACDQERQDPHYPTRCAWRRAFVKACAGGKSKRAGDLALGAATPPLADADAHERALQRRARPRLIGGRQDSALKGLLRALARLLRTLRIDLLGWLGRLGQDDDAIRAHVHEAAEYGEDLFDAAFLHSELSGTERGEERCVVRQDPEVPLAPGRDDHVDVVLVDASFRSDDLEV
jgi:hypothetical protein